MNKWETLRIHMENEANRLYWEINNAFLGKEWAMTRDLAVQIVVISTFLRSMDSIETVKENQRNEAEIEKTRLQAKRDRKRDKRARNLIDNMKKPAF